MVTKFTQSPRNRGKSLLRRAFLDHFQLDILLACRRKTSNKSLWLHPHDHQAEVRLETDQLHMPSGRRMARADAVTVMKSTSATEAHGTVSSNYIFVTQSALMAPHSDS